MARVKSGNRLWEDEVPACADDILLTLHHQPSPARAKINPSINTLSVALIAARR
jgi:hypothetical protein